MVRSKAAKKKREAIAAAEEGGGPAAKVAKTVPRGAAATAAPAAADDGKRDDDGRDPRRVYCSRLPDGWGDGDLEQALAPFGAVEKASVCVDRADASRGFGFVVFEDPSGKVAALAAGFVRGKVDKKTKFAVKVSDVDRDDDDGVCRLWLRRLCPHGSACKFQHPPGRGGPRPESAKVKRCLAFSSKGRCSRGDACEFAHVAAPEKPPRERPAGPKPCFTWARKGKCRKGNACPYAHAAAAAPGDDA